MTNDYDDLPFLEEDVWEDRDLEAEKGDMEYHSLVDEAVMASILEQRCAELVRKVNQLEKENNALRKMLKGYDLIRESTRC